MTKLSSEIDATVENLRFKTFSLATILLHRGHANCRFLLSSLSMQLEQNLWPQELAVFTWKAWRDKFAEENCFFPQTAQASELSSSHWFCWSKFDDIYVCMSPFFLNCNELLYLLIYFKLVKVKSLCYSNCPQSTIVICCVVLPVELPKLSICLTTSIPPLTEPKTTCFPSSHGW